MNQRFGFHVSAQAVCCSLVTITGLCHSHSYLVWLQVQVTDDAEAATTVKNQTGAKPEVEFKLYDFCCVASESDHVTGPNSSN